MAAARAQEYASDRRGRRYAVHTRGYAACRCTGCSSKRWWTPERKAARAAEIRQQYADGRRRWDPRANLSRASHWTPERDGLLDELAGHVDIPTLVERLHAAFGYCYSETAVTHRMKALGIHILDRRPLTTGEVSRMLGVSRETLLSAWVRPGHLPSAHRRGGQHGMHTYTRADVERFASAYAERLDPSRIRDDGLRLLVLARTRGRPLVGTRDVARQTGVSSHVQGKLYGGGLVPSARRVRGSWRGAGAGRYGRWVIEQADVDLVRRLAADRQAEADRRRICRARDGDGRYERAV